MNHLKLQSQASSRIFQSLRKSWISSIYLDYQSTTPVDQRVADKMMPFFCEKFGNPHSRTHSFGWESQDALENARGQVASLINADPKEIIFTSGATESNNLAIKGVSRFYKSSKNHIITLQTEHKCVLDSCRALQEEGFDVDFLRVSSDGLVSLDDIKNAIRPNKTSLVTAMAVNNEIGVIQNIEQIGALCKSHGVFFHTDAAQAAGKIPLDVNKMNIDLMSISSHKLYGPKGVGALYVRRRPRVRLEPLFSGGGQERGLRSGTVPTPLCVGFGEAAEISQNTMETEQARISTLSDRLRRGIESNLSHVCLNGSDKQRYSGCLNFSFSFVEGESLLMALKEVALSSGSACTSASLEPSYVLQALGADEEMAHCSIRFGIGRFTTEKEIDDVIGKVVVAVNKLRSISPLWEMAQDGIDLKTIKWSH
jgi:cysteine desulfurase